MWTTSSLASHDLWCLEAPIAWWSWCTKWHAAYKNKKQMHKSFEVKSMIQKYNSRELPWMWKKHQMRCQMSVLQHIQRRDRSRRSAWQCLQVTRAGNILEALRHISTRALDSCSYTQCMVLDLSVRICNWLAIIYITPTITGSNPIISILSM